MSEGFLVKLPSYKCSPDNYPKEVRIKPLNIKSIRKISSMNQSNGVQIIEAVLNDLVDTDVKELYQKDIEFLILWLRMNSRFSDTSPNIIPLGYTCPNCNIKDSKNIDLSKIEIKELNGYKEPVVVKLPSGIIVKQRLLKLKDLLDISITKEESTIFELVASTLVSANEKEFNIFEEKMTFIDNLESVEDFVILSKFFEEFDYGFPSSLEIECQNCKTKFNVTLPFEDFFRMDVSSVSTGKSYRDYVINK